MGLSIALILLCSLSQDPAPAGGVAAPASAESAVRHFAARIVAAFEGREASEIDPLFDVDRLLDRALDGLELEPMARAGFREGFRKSFRGSRLLQIVPAGAPLECIGVVAGENGIWRARIRIATPGLLFDYVDFEIELVEGEPTVVDVLYPSELTSQSGLARESWLGRAESEGVEAAHSDALRLARLLELERRGENAAALELVEALERDGATSLRLKAQKLRLLGRLGRADRAAKIEAELAEEIENHPEIAIQLYDAAVRAGRLEDALTHIEAVDRRAGDDTYLEYVRALLHRKLGRSSEAKRFLDKAIAESPAWRHPLLVRLDVAVEERDHEATAALLTKLERAFAMDVLAVVTGNAVFAAFRDSEPGKHWVGSRQVDPPADPAPGD